MRNMARSICSVGMRSFIVCFDTGSPAKVTATVDGRNNAMGEALRQAQGDGKKEDGRDESRPYVCSTRRGTGNFSKSKSSLSPSGSFRLGLLLDLGKLDLRVKLDLCYCIS